MRNASTRLLSEWAATIPWISPPVYEMRLGPTPLLAGNLPVTPQLAAMLARANRYADLVGVTTTNILAVEGKMIATPGAISQLQHYINLLNAMGFPAQFPGKPVQGILVWAVDDPIVNQEAVAAGLQVQVYAPQWAVDYLQSKYAPVVPPSTS